MNNILTNNVLFKLQVILIFHIVKDFIKLKEVMKWILVTVTIIFNLH